ncbi:DUF1800 domain-containing protein [Paraburkholderia phosphatilytica]|uniref:DUF1800 domain-containing protein n=1 Tax=Paraburkholderia phosphatilytica TaxID=2282883 RepID=UPI0030B7F6D9
MNEADEAILTADDVRFLLTRTGFEPDPAEVAPYVGLTREQAVDRLLASTRTTTVTPAPAWIDDPIPTRAERKAWTPDEQRAQQKLDQQRYEELRARWVREMIATPSPLTERMTLFWHNHFTSGQDKVGYPQVMARQNELLRRDALGNFGTLLHDVSKDPAMLLYLDGAGNRRGRPNENFAREVMELFTLGEGHYTQQDVTEAARAYTGWTLDPDTQAYVWNPKVHDDGVKTVLGETGPFDGDAVLDILLQRPETANFVTTKLWREFVSDTPDEAQIAPIAARFRASHYDIKVVLRGLFLSDAFWRDEDRGVLVKSPAEFVVGTVRAFDISYDNTAPFAGAMRNLGENLFYPPNVKGWPGGETWINSSTLLARKQFVEQMFRATERAAPHRPAGNAMQNGAMQSGAMSNGAMQNGMTQNGASHVAVAASASAAANVQRAMARSGQGGVRFDLDHWLARFNAAPDAQPGLSAELQMQHAVLPIAPVDAIAVGANGSAYLEALLMDPAYQLK